jgi:hypothetical protein
MVYTTNCPLIDNPLLFVKLKFSLCALLAFDCDHLSPLTMWWHAGLIPKSRILVFLEQLPNVLS